MSCDSDALQVGSARSDSTTVGVKRTVAKQDPTVLLSWSW